MKRRIKKFLKSIGLLKAKPRPGAAIDVDIRGLYQAILMRPPSAAEEAADRQAILSGRLSTTGLVTALLNTPDFGSAFSRHPRAATVLARTILSNLVGVTSEDAIHAYSTGLRGGLPLSDFVAEICSSPDFKARQLGLDAASQTGGKLPSTERLVRDLTDLVETMITARLIEGGMTIAAPPIGETGETPTSASQLVSMIRTLNMMGDTRPN